MGRPAPRVGDAVAHPAPPATSGYDQIIVDKKNTRMNQTLFGGGRGGNQTPEAATDSGRPRRIAHEYGHTPGPRDGYVDTPAGSVEKDPMKANVIMSETWPDAKRDAAASSSLRADPTELRLIAFIRLATCILLPIMLQMSDVARPHAETFLHALQNCGGECDVDIVWWNRGGEPGPGYTSDQFLLHFTRLKSTGSHTRARFDTNYDPPFKAEEFSALLAPSDRSSVLAAFIRDNPFDSAFQSEENTDIADAIKDTISVSLGGKKFEKTFIMMPPTDFQNIKKELSAVAGRLASSGNVKSLNRRIE